MIKPLGRSEDDEESSKNFFVDMKSGNKVSPTSQLSIEVTNWPSSSRYKEIWQRVRLKIRSKLLEEKLLRMSTEDKAVKTTLSIFHPDRGFRNYWNVLISITLLYTAILMPFTMAFLESGRFDFWSILDLVVDFIYFMDLIINFLTPYHDSNGIIITSRSKIFWNYIRSWFIIDLLSCIPFDLLGFLDTKNPNKFIRFLRLPRLYKLFRISKLLHSLNSNPNSNLFIKLQEFFSIKHSVTRLFTSVMTILISLHICSCLWYYTSKLEDFNPSTWVVRLGYQDSDIPTLYITSIYWAVTTLTTVGYGDVFAFTVLEKITTFIWIIIGLYFFAFTVGGLASMMANINTKEKNLNNKLAAIDEFAADTMLNKNLSYKLKHALRFSTEITGFSWIDKQNIFNELPKQLRYEVSLAMHHGAARHISFFVDKDVAVISSIIPFLLPVFVTKNDYVYNQNDFADEIYFLIKGIVDYHVNDKIVNTIYKSDYFGDIEVILQVSRKYSAWAFRDLELLSMNRKLIGNIRTEYSCIWEEIKNVAIEREKKITAYLRRFFRSKNEYKNNPSLFKPTNPNPKNKNLNTKVAELVEYAQGLEQKIKILENIIKVPKSFKRTCSYDSISFNKLDLN